MENWPRKFGLVERRKKTQADQEFWRNQDRYYRVTSEILVAKQSYDGLLTWERRTAVAAAVGLTVDRAVVAGRAAARLWGIDVLSEDRTVELLHTDGKQAGSRRTWPPNVLYRRGNLHAAEVYEEHGMRVTTIPRTLREIAARHGVLEGLVSIDSARTKWPELTRETLTEKLLEGVRFAGKARVREAIELSEPNSGSPLETKARYLIRKADLPGIETVEIQARIDTGPDEYFLVDILINGWLVIELDGRFKLDGTTFGSTDAVLRGERAREVAIQNTGKMVIRSGWEHLETSEDGQIPLLVRIEAALRSHPVQTPRGQTMRTVDKTA
ncbi:hypothetical protein EAH68_09745 [Corynebacterium hylobatis]|uniref:DUF559 domain-containing protein n=2 Tax=Corynebacterium hylobatis TaxID=1859290 RepID=A0A430HXI4_9CORY|nr:hypothetical protein EAH68_09745 [Corynebacterium hylobatis]